MAFTVLLRPVNKIQNDIYSIKACRIRKMFVYLHRN
jgi:hypothetical protein